MYSEGKYLKTFYPEIFFVSGNRFKSACICIEVKTQKFSIERRRQSPDDLQCLACHECTGNSV